LIKPGTILVQKGTLLPPSVRLDTEAYPVSSYPDWTIIKSSLNAHDLERELAASGWTFLYMAGKIRATALGFDKQKSIDKAVGRLLALVTVQKCNCLEIDETATHTFWGIPYVSVSAHSRHIQKGIIFSGTNTPSQTGPPEAAALAAVLR